MADEDKLTTGCRAYSALSAKADRTTARKSGEPSSFWLLNPDGVSRTVARRCQSLPYSQHAPQCEIGTIGVDLARFLRRGRYGAVKKTIALFAFSENVIGVVGAKRAGKSAMLRLLYRFNLGKLIFKQSKNTYAISPAPRPNHKLHKMRRHRFDRP